MIWFFAGFGLEPWFNGTVLFVEIGHVWNEVFDDVHVWQWINLGGSGGSVSLAVLVVTRFINVAKTSQRIRPINVHRARATNSLTARPTKGQSWILLIFDFDQCIQNHGSAFIEVDWISGQIWFLFLFRVPSVDFEIFDSFFLWFEIGGGGGAFEFERLGVAVGGEEGEGEVWFVGSSGN